MNSGRISFGQMIRVLPALAGCLLLSACFHMPSLRAPPDPVYNVRSAAVVSGPNVSQRLLSAVSESVNAAIAATPPNTALPAVALTIRVTQAERGQGYQGDRNTAKVDIDASSVETGSVIAVSSFDTTTFSADGTAVDDLIAEDIAARIRSTYSLTTPRLAN